MVTFCRNIPESAMDLQLCTGQHAGCKGATNI